MILDREKLLTTLSAAEPGLAHKELLEQSASFVFSNGHVMSFNDEVFCRAPSPLGGEFEGAVKGRPLLEALRALEDETVKVYHKEGHLVVFGRQSKAKTGIRAKAEIVLPVDKVKVPKDWLPLGHEFPDAVKLVKDCVSKDESKPAYCCVHFTPKFCEAFDVRQFCRYTAKLGFKQELLLRGNAVKHAAELGACEYAAAGNWCFFRNPDKCVLACRVWQDPYKDLTFLLDVEGEPLSLSESLADAAQRAEKFCEETGTGKFVLVELDRNRCRVSARDELTGFHREVKDIVYKGPAMSFLIPPAVLVEVTKGRKIQECVVAGDPKPRLKAVVGRLTYLCGMARNEKKGQIE